MAEAGTNGPLTCEALERWLDEGAPEPLRRAAEAHAAGCASCAMALRAASEVENLLATATIIAPSGFTDRVMARVAGAAAVRAPRFAAPAFPWWVRAACEPASLLTAAMAALLLWRGDALLGLGSIVVRVANQDWTAAFRSTASLPAFLTHPLVVVGAALAIAPLMLWASWRLYRWSARVVSA